MRAPFALSSTFVLTLVLAGNTAAAEPAPAGDGEATHRLGRPRRASQVAFRVDADTLVGRVGSAPEVRIPAHGAGQFSLRDVPVGAGGAILAVETTSPAGQFTTLLGGAHGAEILASERTDLHGDPGERHAQVLVQGGDGSVAWGTLVEGVTACGERLLPIGMSYVDPNTLRLSGDARPANSTRAPQSVNPATAAEGIVVTPITSDVAPALRPIAQASSRRDPNIAMSVRPSLLVDGDTAAGFPLGSDGFAQFKWPQAALSVERVELWLSSKSPRGGATVWLSADQGRRVSVTVPKGAGAVSVLLNAPWQTRCLAVGTSAGVELSELKVFSGLDRPEFVQSLVGKLVQDGANAAEAADLLADLGAPGALALAPRFHELSTRSKQRALKALARGLAQPAVLARVMEAVRAPDEALSQAGLSVLAEGGHDVRPALRDIAKEPSALGDRALKLLAQYAGEMPTLMDTLVAAGAEERVLLRQIIAGRAKRERPVFDTELARLRATALEPGAATLLAVVAAMVGHPDSASLAEAAIPRASRFEDRYRLAAIAPAVGASSVVDAWLEAQSTGADEWMQRFAAFGALYKRNPASAGLRAARVAADPYPRVRALALSGLRKGTDDSLLKRAAKDDYWPVVRVAGAEVLATRPDLRPELVALLEDPSRKVRAAVIEGLAAQGARDAWPQVAARMQAENEWLEVRVAAVKFAAELCVQDAREPLIFEVRRGLGHEAKEDAQFLAARALEALLALGGAAANDAKLLVERDGAPEPLKKLLLAAPPSTCTAK